MLSTNVKKIHVALVADNWFPVEGVRQGKFGGTQIHIQKLANLLKSRYRRQTSLFYGSRDHALYRLFWPLIIFVDLLLYNRYHRLHLIHTHGLGSAVGARLASWVLKIPHLHTVHGTPYLDQKRFSLFQLFEKIILTKINYQAILALSSHFRLYPNVNANIIEIDNGVDLHEFTQIRVRKAKHPTLIWVGSDDPSKGLAYLKKAIQKVRKVLPKLQTQLISSGTLSRDELIKAFKRSHVFVLPSLSEGQPLSLLEAWAAKIPVVVTPVGEVGQLVVDQVNGLVVEPGNAKQLADSILQILNQKINSKQLIKNGYQTIKDHYSWARTAKQVYTVYKSTLDTFKPIESPTHSLFKRYLRFIPQ